MSKTIRLIKIDNNNYAFFLPNEQGLIYSKSETFNLLVTYVKSAEEATNLLSDLIPGNPLDLVLKK